MTDRAICEESGPVGAAPEAFRRHEIRAIAAETGRNMINYVMVGTNRFEEAVRFYDALQCAAIERIDCLRALPA